MRLSTEQKIQAAIVRIDMAFATIGRLLCLALPVVVLTAIIVVILRWRQGKRK